MQFSLHSGGFSRQMKKPSPIDFHDHPVFPLDGLQIITYKGLFYTYKLYCRIFIILIIIDTKSFYKWQEENNVLSSAFADSINTIAYAAISMVELKT